MVGLLRVWLTSDVWSRGRGCWKDALMPAAYPKEFRAGLVAVARAEWTDGIVRIPLWSRKPMIM